MSVIQGVSISVESRYMRTDQPAARNIDEYIAGFPRDVQQILQKIRTTIRRAAPQAEEAISYQMPTFRLEGNLVHFAAFKNHIGLYPTPSGTEKFREELSPYQTGKGSIRFPLDKPIPYGLIGRIVKFRAKENLERSKARSKARRKKR
jgi:uncharacterized protein YdhG (YjbR/CyaY superfamily)